MITEKNYHKTNTETGLFFIAMGDNSYFNAVYSLLSYSPFTYNLVNRYHFIRVYSVWKKNIHLFEFIIYLPCYFTIKSAATDLTTVTTVLHRPYANQYVHVFIRETR